MLEIKPINIVSQQPTSSVNENSHQSADQPYVLQIISNEIINSWNVFNVEWHEKPQCSLEDNMNIFCQLHNINVPFFSSLLNENGMIEPDKQKDLMAMDKLINDHLAESMDPDSAVFNEIEDLDAEMDLSNK